MRLSSVNFGNWCRTCARASGPILAPQPAPFVISVRRFVVAMIFLHSIQATPKRGIFAFLSASYFFRIDILYLFYRD